MLLIKGHHERIEIQPVSSFCDIMLNVNDVSLLSRTISVSVSFTSNESEHKNKSASKKEGNLSFLIFFKGVQGK